MKQTRHKHKHTQSYTYRAIVRKRILGRRVCSKDGNHPNNVTVEDLSPVTKEDGIFCRVCGAECSQRTDDVDETAVDKRHDVSLFDVNC